MSLGAKDGDWFFTRKWGFGRIVLSRVGERANGATPMPGRHGSHQEKCLMAEDIQRRITRRLLQGLGCGLKYRIQTSRQGEPRAAWGPCEVGHTVETTRCLYIALEVCWTWSSMSEGGYSVTMRTGPQEVSKIDERCGLPIAGTASNPYCKNGLQRMKLPQQSLSLEGCHVTVMTCSRCPIRTGGMLTRYLLGADVWDCCCIGRLNHHSVALQLGRTMADGADDCLHL